LICESSFNVQLPVTEGAGAIVTTLTVDGTTPTENAIVLVDDQQEHRVQVTVRRAL
jgi:hypothetical protein